MANITLQPVAMVVPTEENIYAPSRFEKRKTITEAEFFDRYADHASSMWVSFEPDYCSKPQRLTAYGHGYDAWWIISHEND